MTKNNDTLKETIRQMVEEKHMSRDLVHSMIENMIKAGYKKQFGSDENCYIEFADDDSKVEVFIKRNVVNDGEEFNSLTEIELSKAKEYDESAEVGDEILEVVDPKSFDRLSIHAGKQKFKQSNRDVEKNQVYSKYKQKEKDIIEGVIQTTDEKTGDVYIDLHDGVFGKLPKSAQSPIEHYKKGEKIFCYLDQVRLNENNGNVDIMLSRNSGELVRKFLERKIPEIQNKSIEIYKIVRQAGYKTKVAVYATKDNIDPVGTCVGIKGNKIQSIITELNGEKIDIIEFNNQLEIFISNALTPAVIKIVRITDYNLRKAIAVVEERDLSFAIGKAGMNVLLANRLTDWLIDIKTEEQYKELDLDRDIKNMVDELYENIVNDDKGSNTNREEAVDDTEEEEELLFESLPFSARIKEKIANKNISTIDDFAALGDIDIMEFFQFTTKEYNDFISILSDYVEIVEE